MADSLSAPNLTAALARIRGRERRRARDAGIRRTLAATAAAVILVALARIAARVFAREPLPLTAALALTAVVFLVGVWFVVRGVIGRSDVAIARDVDRRLGLHDRAASALAVLAGGASSRLAADVVLDADRALAAATARIDAAFPDRAERRVTWGVRMLGRIAVVAVILAVIAELLGGGPIRILPGFVSGPGTPNEVMPPTDRAPRREEGGGPRTGETRGPGDAPSPKEVPPDARDEPEPGGIRVALKMSKDEYETGEALTGTATAAPTGTAAPRRVFDVRIEVDGVEVDTGTVVSTEPGSAAGGRAELDLARLPGLALAPGEHRARARLTTRTDHEEHVSAPVTFRIRPPKDDPNEGGPKENPKAPRPEPKPDTPPPEPTASNDGNAPPAEPPPPPPATDKHYVVPLFAEGDTVKKRGPVLVLDPSGGEDAPAERRDAALAIPAARRRAEETVDRARLDARDRELVRRYFELLSELVR